jgi:hypothetical protein
MTVNWNRLSRRSITVALLAASCALPAVSAPGADTSASDTIHAVRTAPQHAAARQDSAAHPVRAAKRKMPPIDIRALASGQATTAPGTPVAPAVRPAERTSGFTALVAALVVAGSSTMLILLAIARRGGRKRTVSLPVPDAVTAAETDVEEPVALPESTDDDEETLFGVGGDLRNARGEFDLAMRLHSGSMGDGARRSARSACTPDATTAQRVKVAKRLGIGRGEIDLALRLQKLESVPAEEEHS